MSDSLDILKFIKQGWAHQTLARIMMPSKIERKLLRLQRRNVLVDLDDSRQSDAYDSGDQGLVADLHFLLGMKSNRRSNP